MVMITSIQERLRFIALLVAGISLLALAGCKGDTTAPFGSTITVEKFGDAVITGPTTSSLLYEHVTTKSQPYRITVLDATGQPMDGITLDLVAQFSEGMNITFGKSFGDVAPITLSTDEKAENGVLMFHIVVPFYARKTKEAPFNQSGTPGKKTGVLVDDTYVYTITTVDDSGESTAQGSFSVPVSGVTNSVTGIGTGSVELTWANVSGAKKYNVYGGSSIYGATLEHLFTVVCGPGGCTDPVTTTDLGNSWPIKTGNPTPPLTNTTGLGNNGVKGNMQVTSGSSVAMQAIEF